MADQRTNAGVTTPKKDEPEKPPELTEEQKRDKEVQEANQKENEKRDKLVTGVIKDLQERLEEYGGEDLRSVLTEIKWRVNTMEVVAAGADMGVQTPQTVKELTEEHCPYLTPPTPLGKTPFQNVAPHVAEMDEETKSKRKSKKAA